MILEVYITIVQDRVFGELIEVKKNLEKNLLSNLFDKI